MGQDLLLRSNYPITNKNMIVLKALKCIISEGRWPVIKKKRYRAERRIMHNRINEISLSLHLAPSKCGCGLNPCSRA